MKIDLNCDLGEGMDNDEAIMPYITSATTDARAKKESIPVVMMAAGAAPVRTASSRTAVVVDEPRLNGTQSTHPAAIWPDSGWRLSVISPVR